MLPTYRVILMRRAFKDLNAVFGYIARESPQNARTTIDRLQGSMQSLDHLPTRCKVHEARKDPLKTVRSMSVAPFIVYYRIDDARRIVRVLTVRHGYRLQPKRFR